VFSGTQLSGTFPATKDAMSLTRVGIPALLIPPPLAAVLRVMRE
jgi:hypothetical protein